MSTVGANKVQYAIAGDRGNFKWFVAIVIGMCVVLGAIDVVQEGFSPSILWTPLFVLAMVGGLYEGLFRQSNYLILHPERLDVCALEWGLRARGVDRIRYDQIESVTVSDSREVIIQHHLPLSGGKFTSYTRETKFTPAQPDAVATEIRRRAALDMSLEVEAG